jgi:dipeptidyl aminopeptidase/acylaminoacyl peptidase
MQTDADRSFGQFSPDGKMIAYSSTESGRWEIYVQPFPGPGTKSRISTAGGISARWGPDGKELFYIALDDRLMAVPIQLASDGESVEARTPVPLFTTRVGGALQQTGFTPQYVVATRWPVPHEHGRGRPKRVAHYGDSELEGEILIG